MMAVEVLTGARVHARRLLRLAQEGNGQASRELMLYMADRLGDLDTTEREALSHALRRLASFDHNPKRTPKITPANAFMPKGHAAVTGASHHKHAMEDVAVLHAVEMLSDELIWKALPGLCVKDERILCPEPVITQAATDDNGEVELRHSLEVVARALHDGIEGKPSRLNAKRRNALVERVRRARDRALEIVAPFSRGERLTAEQEEARFNGE